MQQVEKPSAGRQPANVCLVSAHVELIRALLLERGKVYAPAMVSVSPKGLRAPEELMAVETEHARARTILVEQGNIRPAPKGSTFDRP